MTPCPECASEVSPYLLAETSYNYCLGCSHQWLREEEDETPTVSGNSPLPYGNTSPSSPFFDEYLNWPQLPAGQPEALIEAVGPGLVKAFRVHIGLPPNAPAPAAPKPTLQHWSTRVGRL